MAGLPDPAFPRLARERKRPDDDRPPLLWPGLRTFAGAALAILAVLFLQLLLSAYFWVADPALHLALKPTWDIGVLVLLLVGWAALGVRRRWATRALITGLSVVVFFYFLLGIGQGFALREFGYDVILRLHLSYVPELFRMMYQAESTGRFILYVALMVLAIFVILFAIHGSLRCIHAFARAGRWRQIGLAGGAVAGFLAGAALIGVSGSISAEAYRQVDLAINLDGRINSTARRLEIEAAGLRRLSPFTRGSERPTILLFVVESYGQVLFSHRQFADFPGWLAEKGRELGEAGYHVASKEMLGPVFGGSSWLAGSSLLCGVRIDNQKRFKALFASAVHCLPSLLNQAGYRTVMSAANAKVLEPSYKRTFPFEQFYFLDDFGYRGPRMGWSFMPDQFTLDFVHRREVAQRVPSGRAGAEPLFVAYFLTSSHHPWATIPPFISDWSRIGDGSIYGELPVTRFDANGFVRGQDYKPAYRTSIEYSLQSIASYLERLPPDDRSLIIILGDHQPRRPIGRMKQDPWTMPIHVLSRDPAAVARFARVGYRPGFTPVAQDGTPSGLERFVEELFVAYQDGGASRP